MAQETKIVDIRRSFLPIDPNAFPPTYHATESEDTPEPRVPVVAYDGHNFMPTPQGYASYFGINSILGISTLIASGGTGNVDDIFMIQTNTLQNILVALCDDGIWTKAANASGTWTHVITLPPPIIDGMHLQWSKCVIENAIYVYRQGELSAYVASPTNGFVFTAFTPTFLNMIGQLGIFKAGGRLGFWDSENSIAWSALGTPTDFTPDPKTLSGATIFQDIVGRIVTVLQHGTGFVIYCTRSIVHVTRNLNSPLIWAGSAIFNGNGISYREEACFAEPDTKHFAYTTQGIVEINRGQPEFVTPEVATYLKEQRQPVYIKIINGRYLFFPILDASYLTGIVKFTSEEFGAITQAWDVAAYNAENMEVVCKSYNSIDRQSREIHLFNTFGYTRCGQAVIDGQVRKYRDNLVTSLALSTIETYKASGIDPNFNTNGAVVAIDSTTKHFLPNVLLKTAAAFSNSTHQEDNTNNFYKKQEMLWAWEDAFTRDWIKAIENRQIAPITNVVLKAVPYNPTLQTVERDVTNFGPYVLPSFESESNRYYGKAPKSQWLQRSLTQLLQVRVFSEIKYALGSTREARWEEIDFPLTGVVFNTYNDVRNSGLVLSTLNSVSHEANALKPFTGVTYVAPVVAGTVKVSVTYTGGGGGTTNFTFTAIDPGADIADIPANLAGQGIGAGNYPVWIIDGSRTQTFKTSLQFTAVDACVYKQLGFTDIIGHGKFDANCNFTLTDSNPEAPDYTDVCLTEPDTQKRKQPQILDAYFTWQDIACGQFDVVINSITYSYPQITLTIPGGTILLQDGSIEPIYPTFLGAFVFDLQYKKWGKMKLDYKQLLDYFPINNVAGDAPIPYDVFLPKAAALLPPGDTRTNLFLQSQTIQNAPWANINTPIVTGNFALAPDGTMTATKIEDNDAASFEGRAQSIVVPDDSLMRVFSIFVKKTTGGTSPTFGVNFGYAGGGTPISLTPRFNTDLGTVVAAGGATVCYVVDYSATYWRCVMGFANNGTGNTVFSVVLYPATGPHNSSGDSAATVGSAIFWGAQFELGSVATKYIKTEGAAVTFYPDVIALFDQFPTDSRIVFGKLGLYRKGFTDLHEVRIQNRSPMAGTVAAEGSLDGKNVESWLNQTQAFADATQVTANFGLSARWFNLIVEGNYDIIAMEARTSRKGKR